MFVKKNLIIFTIFLTFIASSVHAQTNDALQQIRADAKTLNQLPSTNPQEVIGLVIKALMMFMGAIMFLLIVYAGTMWMTANGNEDKIGKAKNIIVWAVLGTTVMLTSYIVVNFVFGQLSQ